MTGRKGQDQYRTLLLVIVVIIQLMTTVFILPAGGGPTRGPGMDIEVSSITSHSDGEIVGFAQQAFTALVVNSGSDNYLDDVNVTLSISFPANETENMTVVHTESLELGDSLREIGNQTVVTYLPWMPAEEGYYLVEITAEVTDDHPGNDSASITIRVTSSHIEGVKVSFAPGSPSSQKIKRGENTQMFGYEPYVFKVENTGVYNDTYNITVDSAWVMAGFDNQTDELAPGEFELIRIDVAVPLGIDPKSFDVLVFTAISQRNESISDSKNVTTSIPIKEGVEVTVISKDPQIGYPGGPPVEFAFKIRNSGDWATHYVLTVTSRPSNWNVELLSSSVTQDIPVGLWIIAYARITIPPLVYETMDKDRTEEGQTGALILTATSPSGVADSAEGTVDVGLVHTVKMEITPNNITIPFTEESKTAPQILNISVRVRSINNNKADPGADLEVNLSTPEGPNGVLFKPIWFIDFDRNISSNWSATPPVGMIKLSSGQWSQGQFIRVIGPPFPFQGTAVIKIVATPILIEGREGMAIPASARAEIHIEPFINYTLRAPRTEFYNDPELLINDDENMNGVEDWREGSPGDTLYLPFNITNTGNGWDRYVTIGDAIPIEPTTLLPDDWVIDMNTTTGTLIPFRFKPASPGHSFIIWVSVRIPDGAPIGEGATIKVGAASYMEFDEDKENPAYKWAEIDIHVLQGFGVDLEPEVTEKAAEPQETITYRLNATNIGNGVDIIRFRLQTPDLMGWNITFDIEEVELVPKEKMTLTIRVTPDLDAVRDDVLALKVRAQSGMSVDAFDEVWVNTTVNYRGGVELMLLDTPSLIWRYPGETATFLVEMFNRGNGNDTMEMTLDPGNSAWTAVLDHDGGTGFGASIPIPRAGSIKFRVNITLPALELVRNEQELYEQGIQALNKVSTMLNVHPREYPSIRSSLNLTVGVLQDYKASITPVPGEYTIKDVLVGEKVDFMLQLENKGNGEDRVLALPTSPSNSIRHLSWTQIEEGPYGLRPFERAYLNLSIMPVILDKPLFNEHVDIDVEAMAGDNLTYRRVNLSARIVMSRLVSGTEEVDLGTMEYIKVRICNMPDPGTVPTLELPHQRIYQVTSALDRSGVFGVGWTIPVNDLNVTLTSFYQLTDVEIPIVGPPELITGSPNALVNIDIVDTSVGALKKETLDTFLRAVYFDVEIDSSKTRFQDLFEGEKGRAYITLIATGNRGQDSIPVLVKIDGEIVSEIEVPRVDPQDYNTGLPAGGGEQEVVFDFKFDLPRLRWYEKGKEMRLEVIIDPDDRIIENKPQGGTESENNNVMVSEFTIKNYVPPLAIWFLALVLLFLSMLFGFIGYFFMKKKESWFLIPLAVGAAGGFGMMFFVPLEDAMEIGTANTIGLSIILIDLLFIMPVMIFFFTRSGDAYITDLINRRRGEEPIEGTEITKTVWKPILISLIGGLLMVSIPLLFWVVPSEIDEGIVEVFKVMTSVDNALSVLVMILAVPLISVGLQAGLIMLKKGSLRKINRTWDNLERLKKEIEEGFQ